jgi:hypothetical protein
MYYPSSYHGSFLHSGDEILAYIMELIGLHFNDNIKL